jgi:hypothetical protein
MCLRRRFRDTEDRELLPFSHCLNQAENTRLAVTHKWHRTCKTVCSRMQALLEESFGSFPQRFCFNRNSGGLLLHRTVAISATKHVVSAAPFVSRNLQNSAAAYTRHTVDQDIFLNVHTARTSSSAQFHCTGNREIADYSATATLIFHTTKERGS